MSSALEVVLALQDELVGGRWPRRKSAGRGSVTVELREEVVIDGRVIPKGTEVVLSPPLQKKSVASTLAVFHLGGGATITVMSSGNVRPKGLSRKSAFPRKGSIRGY